MPFLREGEETKYHSDLRCNHKGFTYEPETDRWVCGGCRKQTIAYAVECDICEEWVMPHKNPGIYGVYVCLRCEYD